MVRSIEKTNIAISGYKYFNLKRKDSTLQNALIFLRSYCVFKKYVFYGVKRKEKRKMEKVWKDFLIQNGAA